MSLTTSLIGFLLIKDIMDNINKHVTKWGKILLIYKIQQGTKIYNRLQGV